MNHRYASEREATAAAKRLRPEQQHEWSSVSVFRKVWKRGSQRSSASSLTDSLRSVVRLRRAVSAHSKAVIRLSTESGITQERTCEQKASKRPGTVKRPRCWRFSIGSAPLTSITKIDAQVRGGETRQDYKDTRRFPLEAPSCALLFRPCRLPDTCPPFSLREAWRFLIAHAVGISVRCRSFAPSWAVCTNPPFSPTAAPYPVTIVLSPTR